MAIGLSIDADVKKARKQMTRLERKAVPKAIEGTVNDLAFEGKKRETKAMESRLHNPVSFTKKGIIVRKAKNPDLTSIVEVKARTWDYLEPVIFGQTENKAHAIPVGRKPNAKGNLTPAQRKPRKNEFFATIKGTRGIYKRQSNGGVKLMVHFQDQATKKKRYPWGDAISLLVTKATRGLFQKNWKRALARFSG